MKRKFKRNKFGIVSSSSSSSPPTCNLTEQQCKSLNDTLNRGNLKSLPTKKEEDEFLFGINGAIAQFNNINNNNNPLTCTEAKDTLRQFIGNKTEKNLKFFTNAYDSFLGSKDRTKKATNNCKEYNAKNKEILNLLNNKKNLAEKANDLYKSIENQLNNFCKQGENLIRKEGQEITKKLNELYSLVNKSLDYNKQDELKLESKIDALFALTNCTKTLKNKMRKNKIRKSKMRKHFKDKSNRKGKVFSR